MLNKGDESISKIVNIILLFSIIGSIYGMYTLKSYDKSLNNYGKEFICRGKILSYEKKTKYMYKYIFEIQKIYSIDKKEVKLKNHGIKIYLYVSDKYNYGDVLTVNIEYEKPKGKTNERWF